MATNNSSNIWASRKSTKQVNRNGKKKNYMDTSNDKLGRLDMKNLKMVKKKKTSREKPSHS